MNRFGRGTLLFVLGSTALWLTITGAFGAFVQQRMRLPLALAGGFIALLGVIEMVTSEARERTDPGIKRRFAAPTVGWLLMLPIVILMAVAPSALGASAVNRARGYVPAAAAQAYPDLPDTDVPTPMRVYDYVDQAVWDRAGGLEGHPILLEGFVVNDPAYPDGFVLVRFAVSCCAADGVPLRVAIPQTDADFPDDTWLHAVVTWIPPPDGTYFNVPDVPYAIEGELYIESDLLSYEILTDPPDSPYEQP